MSIHVQRIRPERLLSLVASVLRFHGVPDEDAELVADSLIQADLWGHESHGVLRLGWYVARLRSGSLCAISQLETMVDGGAIAVLDGHNGIGQVVAAQAARDAISRARVHGIGAVSVRNSNHFGTAMYFTRMAALEGCIAMLATNASPAMPPWGGRRKAVGTNPWSIAVPAGRYGLMVMDIANTAVARGKVYLARQHGTTIPPGWATDAEGVPTTDPDEAIAGMILPMAGHKGYAIAVMMDALSGVLSGSKFGANVHGPYEPEAISGCGHFMLALHIDAFQDRLRFIARVEQLIAELKAVPTVPGTEEIFYPGEPELRREADNRRDGLLLPGRTLADLEQLARDARVPFLTAG